MATLPKFHAHITVELQLLRSFPRPQESRALLVQAIATMFRDSCSEMRLGIDGVFVKLVVPKDVSLDVLEQRAKEFWQLHHHLIDD